MTATLLSTEPFPPPAAGMDPAFYALSQFRRRRFDACIATSTNLLGKNPFDQQAWYIKTRALTLKHAVDDTEMEEVGVAELLLDENSMASLPRPGTSLQRGNATASGRPVSNSGRPPSGYARPGTGSRGGSGVEGAFQGNRPGTSRPVTTSGRFVRLGTASMQSEPGGPFINIDRMDLKKYAQRPPLAKALCDYLLYVDHNPRKALELCAEATQATNLNDWWWKARLGKCYYQLGLLRDAEKQFKSSLRHQETITTLLELGKVYYKLDQPLTAMELFEKGAERNPLDHHLLLNVARLYDELNDSEKAAEMYKKVLELDSSNIESAACLAATHFYDDQPEMALRMYRRLLQMGVNTTELWNNLGLCCFFAAQYDMTLSCFERALNLANDSSMANVWYNIGQVGIGIGDVGLAYQAFKIAASIDPNHGEAFNNLGILELRKANSDQARNNFATASHVSPNLHEAWYNAGLLHYKMGEFQDAFQMCSKALEAFPLHPESLELKKLLRSNFSAV